MTGGTDATAGDTQVDSSLQRLPEDISWFQKAKKEHGQGYASAASAEGWTAPLGSGSLETELGAVIACRSFDGRVSPSSESVTQISRQEDGRAAGGHGLPAGHCCLCFRDTGVA